MATSTIEKYRVNVETYGEGERRVVALHCALGRAASWKQYAAQLGGTVTITAPDWPGHGKSATWNESGLMRHTARDIVAELVGDEAVDLVGHSYGGSIALEFATRFPERVRSLTLIEPIYLAVAGADNRPLLDEYLEQMQPHFEALTSGRHEIAAKLFIDVWGGDTRWEDLPLPAKQGLTQQIPVVEAFKPGDETASEDMETLALLERLSMPLSIIYGDNTMPVLKQVVQGLKARLPHAEVVEVKRASHMLPLTHANDVTEQLRSLWTA